MPIGITMVQHTIYRQSGPVWVNDMDPVWIITVAPFGSYNNTVYRSHSRMVIVPSGTYGSFPYPLLWNMQV